MSVLIPRPVRHLGLAFLVGLAGCAGTPPKVAISNAEIAIGNADSVGAAQYRLLELHVARKKLESATQALEKGESEVARRLAEQAQVDGELVEARTQAAKARQIADEVTKTLNAPRGEGSGRPVIE